MPKHIRIKNEIPELLEALCVHPNCPEWLKEGVWDLVHDQNARVLYTANEWRAQFEAINDYDNNHQDRISVNADPLDSGIVQ